MGALPPPGFYAKEYLSYYNADKLKDNDGRTLTLAGNGAELDRLAVSASATRFIYVTPIKVLGLDYAVHMVVPLVRAHMKMNDVSIPGGRLDETRGDLADMTFGPLILAFHSKDGFFMSAVAWISLLQPAHGTQVTPLISGRIVGALCQLTPAKFFALAPKSLRGDKNGLWFQYEKR